MEDNTGFLTLLMNLAGPIVLGLAIFYLVYRTRTVGWRRKRRTEAAAERLYNQTEQDRQRKEATDIASKQ